MFFCPAWGGIYYQARGGIFLPGPTQVVPRVEQQRRAPGS